MWFWWCSFGFDITVRWSGYVKSGILWHEGYNLWSHQEWNVEGIGRQLIREGCEFWNLNWGCCMTFAQCSCVDQNGWYANEMCTHSRGVVILFFFY